MISYSASSAAGSRGKGPVYKTVSRESRVDELLFGKGKQQPSGSAGPAAFDCGDRHNSAPGKTKKPEQIQVITKDLIRKLMYDSTF